MNVLQKIVKSGYLLLLLLINGFALMSVLLALIQRRFVILAFALLPLGIALFLALLLGYIEQRYLVPVYPFFLVLAVWFVGDFLMVKRKKPSTT